MQRLLRHMKKDEKEEEYRGIQRKNKQQRDLLTLKGLFPDYSIGSAVIQWNSAHCEADDSSSACVRIPTMVRGHGFLSSNDS